jgi:hypothetical protein
LRQKKLVLRHEFFWPFEKKKYTFFSTIGKKQEKNKVDYKTEFFFFKRVKAKMKKRYFAQNEELEESRNVIPVTALTKKKAMALLDGYTRVQGLFGVQGAGCRALKNLQHVKDLFVLIKKENRYFALQGITVEDLLMQTEESGESLCKVLINDLFGLSESQYRTIRKEFAAKDGEYGIFVKDQGQFGIFVNIPGQEAWYNDRRVQKAILSTGVVGAGVSLGSYFVGKRVGAQETGAEQVTKGAVFRQEHEEGYMKKASRQTPVYHRRKGGARSDDVVDEYGGQELFAQRPTNRREEEVRRRLHGEGEGDASKEEGVTPHGEGEDASGEDERYY